MIEQLVWIKFRAIPRQQDQPKTFLVASHERLGSTGLDDHPSAPPEDGARLENRKLGKKHRLTVPDQGSSISDATKHTQANKIELKYTISTSHYLPHELFMNSPG
ncbi:MAG: hypothetical protein WD180_12125 [Pseudohongiellaceae bacterium]